MVAEYVVKAYTLDELDDDARKKVIESARTSLSESLYSDSITYSLTEFICREIGDEEWNGTTIPFELCWSLGYCQGDGVAIYGKFHPHHLPAIPLPSGTELVELVRNSYGHHYSHYNSFDVYVYVDGEVVDAQEVEKMLREVCMKAERFGYELVDEQTSEGNAREWALDMGAAFFADGTIIPWQVRNGKVEA